MSDRMEPLRFQGLLRWILEEYAAHGSIFGIPKGSFYQHKRSITPYLNLSMFGEEMETPFGPAAGPHTQLSQNIVTAYLTGSRFIELKTVQIMDDLELEKPCIDASDEGYNTEWSQELPLEQSLDEYVKSWILIHLLKEHLGLSVSREGSGFIFNMSVGYDLSGIQSEKMDRFINSMIDAEEMIAPYLETVHEKFPEIAPRSIPSAITNSVTISTMHGCPPQEIESMASYLIREKGLNTYVKLNPTLLGEETVLNILKATGFDYICIDKKTFEHDLRYQDALLLIRNLQKTAREHKKRFGIKLSNTLANRNLSDRLSGKERYMSGRALFPLTINLAYRLASDMKGKINISFCGGASVFNIKDILDTGIYPVTIATDILKPGGYMRLYQIARYLERHDAESPPPAFGEEQVDTARLKELAERSLDEPYYKKSGRKRNLTKLNSRLGFFDCITAPCVQQCPIHQDVPEYIDSISKKDYTAALGVILRRNPLPNITGFICDHACVERCVRWDYDNPVHIRELKRFAATNGDYDKVISNIRAEIRSVRSKRRRKKVAVIGSGPGGLAAGSFLAREGFDVTIFERYEKPGGTVRWTIPRFRLPDSVIDDDISLVRELGVNIETGQTGKYSIEGLKSRGFDYVIIATGAMKPKELAICRQGVKEGYYNSVDFLQRIKRGEEPFVGKRVLVIGGGNSAIDAARAAWRQKPDSVSVVYRRDIKSMPADREEIEACIEEGIKIEQLLQPYELSSKNGRITGLKCQRVRLGAPDETGRPRPVPVKGSDVSLEADTIITAVGEEVEPDILHQNGLLLTSEKTVVVNDGTGQTNRENVYAVGDCVRGPATVIEAIADARRVASAIVDAEKIDAEGIVEEEKRVDTRRAAASFPSADSVPLIDSIPIEGSENTSEQRLSRHGEVIFFNPVETLRLEKRDSLSTVIRPLTEKNASKESKRCLRCNTLCNRCVETCPNRANIGLFFQPLSLEIPAPGLLKANSLKGKTGSVRPVQAVRSAHSVHSVRPPAHSIHPEDRSPKVFCIEQSTQILHLDDLCNECGNCQTFCPHDGKPYRDKITLFSREALFEKSTNSGFYPLPRTKNHARRYGCRINGVRFDLTIDPVKEELGFLSPGFTLLFGIQEPAGKPVLKSSFLSGSDIPDMESLFGLYLTVQTVFNRYNYLLTMREIRR